MFQSTKMKPAVTSRVTTIVFACALVFVAASEDYWEKRNELIKSEESEAIGANIQLTEKEEAANKILMNHKLKEYDFGFLHPEKFLPAIHFFKSKDEIEKSEVFKFIRKLPKGASLHGHISAMASGEYVYNLTYSDDLYTCVEGKQLKLKFFKVSPDKTCKWELVSALRRRDPTFDETLRKHLNIIVDNPKEAYKDVNSVWEAFSKTFKTIQPLINYEPVLKKYLYRALEEFHQDNVKYVEFRGTLSPVYDSDGNKLGPMEIVNLYKEVVSDFMGDYTDFMGAKFIYAPQRAADNVTAENYLQVAKELKETFPEFMAGFDLVGQEELGKPLISFIKDIEEMRDHHNMKFFFHAGETNWYGSSADLNLVDAVLLGTHRIGHGFALTKHPKVLEMLREKNIAVEVCPISNQVLNLVSDLRNHPAVSLVAQGYPVVICNDDPSFWGAKGLSYDWYMAFMAFTSRDTDLRFLKQLAMNSLMYSSLSEAEKEVTLNIWKYDWDKFIGDIVNQDDKSAITFYEEE